MAVTFECSNEYFDEAGNSLGERISSSQNTVARYRFRDVSGAAPDPTLYEYIAHIQQAESVGEKNYFAAYSAYDGWQDQPGNWDQGFSRIADQLKLVVSQQRIAAIT